MAEHEAGGPHLSDRWVQGLLDDGRREDAGARRRREWWLRQQAGESGSFAGVLTDLGERGATISVGLATGRHLTGSVAAVGRDALGLRGPRHRSVVQVAWVTWVRPEPDAPATVGDRAVTFGSTLHEQVQALLGERDPVTVHTADGEVHHGNLRAVGTDVVTLRREQDRHIVHLPLPAITDLRSG